MKLDLFDYDLPPEAIAQCAVEPRDSSRLMVVHRASGRIEHRIFRDLLEYLSPGDLLVLNNTRVRAARLVGVKPTGARVEALVLEILSDRRCRCLVKPGKRALPGTHLTFADGRTGRVVEKTDEGGRLIEMEAGEPLDVWLERVGTTPLPPYIHTTIPDPGRYQTVYSQRTGSAAAPTAGLHFTRELLDDARMRGIRVAEVTLHIGIDTFRPVKTPEIEAHEMHSEWYTVPSETVEAIGDCTGRVVAVGTTCVRTLESAAVSRREVRSGSGVTRLYIRPGYSFQCVDALITNFHVPRSSLLILVSALTGRDLILRAYQEARDLGYRFLSLGDVMLLVE